MKKLLIALLFLPVLGSAQSGISKDLMDTYDTWNVHFVSESIVRAVINYVDTTGTLRAIGDDIEKVVFFTREMDSESANALMDRMSSIAIGEGFESMLAVDNKELNAVLYGLSDDDKTEGVVVTYLTGGTVTYLEFVGDINLMYFIQMFGKFGQGGNDAIPKELSQITDLLNLNLDF